MTIHDSESVASVAVRPSTRCAPWARECGLRPAGSAVRAPGGVLLVQWPLPWPRDVKDVAELAPVLRVATPMGVRVLLVAGASPPEGDHTISFHARPVRPDGLFVQYEPRELQRSRAEVVDGALALLDGAAGEVEPPASEVVVCTHGKRDVCCGGAGTALHVELHAVAPAGVRVWRSSHQGGHRFAPTAIVLPDATSWAQLDVAAALAIVRRSEPVASLISRYRGSTAIDDARPQVLEGIAFAEEGWSWLDSPRRGVVLDTGVAEVFASVGRWHGVVEAGELRVGPDCGGAPGAVAEFDEWVLHAHCRVID